MSKTTRNVTFTNAQRKVFCAVCKESLIYKNLVRHFTQFHENETPREKLPEGMKSLTTFFPAAQQTNELVLNEGQLQLQSNEISESVDSLECADSNEFGLICEESIVQRSSDCNYTELLSKLNDIHKVVISKTYADTSSDSIRSLDEKLQLVLDNFLKLHIDSPIKASKVTSSVYNEKDVDSACAAGSIDDIMERLNNWKLHYPNVTSKENCNPDGLYCIFCNTEMSEIKGITGVIHYDFSLGDNFKRAKVLPREFRNFKIKLRAHMDSPFHAGRVNEHLKAEAITHSKSFLSRNEKAGITCARNAYKAIYSNHSYISYETEIAKDAANNVEVGELNHSSDFCSEMVECFDSCLKSRFREQILLPLKGTGRPSPVTFIFDKYTPMHRTLNIIAANTYIGGSLQTVFLDCPVVQHHDAKGVADNLSTSIRKLYANDQWKKSYCGTSADGQMICLGYGSHLDDMVSANGDQFYTHVWDAGHLVELASKDSIEHNQWVSDVTAKVTEVTKKFKYGKQLEEIIKIQNENNPDGRLYSPKSFSTTRWATYCYTTLMGFLNNYPYYYDHLQQSQDDLNDKINNLDFVLKCALLTDVYWQVSLLSRTLKCPHLHSWHIETAVTITCDNLFEMSDVLKDEKHLSSDMKNVTSPHSEDFLLRHTGDALSELSQFFTYKSKPVLNKEHLPIRTRAAAAQPKCRDQSQIEATNRCRKEVAKFLDSLIENLKSRMDANNYDILNSACDAFDLQKIYRREEGNEDGVSAFITYAEAAMKVNFLEPYTIDELKVQYVDFEAFVKNAKEEWYDTCSFAKKREFETKLYRKLLHNPSTFTEVNHLLASATVRLANESQCEAIGSVVGRHYEQRGSLNVEKLSKEVFISWNGPPPFSQINTLLRDALYLRFNGGPERWHFLRLTRRPDLLKMFAFESKVVDRLNRLNSRINYNYDYD